jgi:hypothetical protein
MVLAGCLPLQAQAQTQTVSALFQEEKPLSLEFTISIREVKKNLVDSVYFPAQLKYQNPDGRWDSLAAGVRARGNFRRENCYYPPLRVKIKKSDAANTVFAGNKNLKLVLPCQTSKDANYLILKEYLGYKLYEPFTPYIFNTRLVNVTLHERQGKQVKSHQLVGFLIEDDDLVADRFDGKIRETTLHPLQLEDTTAITHDFFQYMISNTDWSSVTSHNIKVLQMKPARFIPLAYDFDMSGLVNAPYAKPSPLTGQNTVRDRVYRGFCRNDKLVYAVRQQYLGKENEVKSVIDDHASHFSEKQLSDIRSFIGEFFNTLKSDRLFKDAFIDRCRKN